MGEKFGEFKKDLALLPHGNGVHEEILNRYVNDRYMAIISAFPWTRLDVSSSIQVPVKYDTGTLAVANESTDVVLTDGVLTIEMDRRRIRIAGRPEYYTLSFVDSTHFSIDRGYEGPDETAATYRIWQALYPLAHSLDYLKAVKLPRLWAKFGRETQATLDLYDPARRLYGSPTCYAPAPDSPDGEAQIEIYPGPELAEGLLTEFRIKLERMKNALEEFPDWIDTEVLFVGVEASLYGLAGNASMKNIKETEFQMGLKGMIDSDIQRMPAGVLRMDEAWTQHRAERDGAKLGSWNQNSRWGSDSSGTLLETDGGIGIIIE